MSAQSDPSLHKLSDQLSLLSTEDQKMAVVLSFISEQSTQVRPNNDIPDISTFDELLDKHNLGDAFSQAYTSGLLDAGIPASAWGCPQEGRFICSNCKIVSYCSHDCQKMHWKIHKRDCRDPIRAVDWRPAWIIEGRLPTWADPGLQNNIGAKNPLSLGMSLWGNMPAIDILNLSQNEGIKDDISVIFTASGDLRNVICTINELPIDYEGALTIVMNDINHHVALRNILLLCLLGKTVNKRQAADVALHLWYSSFVPEGYHHQAMACLLDLAKSEGGSFDVKLSHTSSLSGLLNSNIVSLLKSIHTATYGVDDATKELNRIRFAPSRTDLHHRHYYQLEPSHRLSFLEFRRYGLVLPFGARNYHFNYPNRFLFSSEGRWLQNDHNTPLQSWDITAVLKAGKSHGALRADLFGCLYFYLSDQLYEFAQRLSRFKISFKMYNTEASGLLGYIHSGSLSSYSLPASIRFDRIDVSNIVDMEYVGLRKVLQDWGGMLKETRCATLVGYFMNWAINNEGARPGRADFIRILKVLIREGRLPSPFGPPGTSRILSAAQMDYIGAITAYHNSLTAVYDNSEAFSNYLESQGLMPALRYSKLQLKSNHTIVPHRLCAPLGRLPSHLPVFPDKESWYLNANVAGFVWSERYVEFSRMNA